MALSLIMLTTVVVVFGAMGVESEWLNDNGFLRDSFDFDNSELVIIRRVRGERASRVPQANLSCSPVSKQPFESAELLSDRDTDDSYNNDFIPWPKSVATTSGPPTNCKYGVNTGCNQGRVKMHRDPFDIGVPFVTSTLYHELLTQISSSISRWISGSGRLDATAVP